MTDYFVAPSPVGNDTTGNGLGQDASHATNRPWATIEKALNTGSVIDESTGPHNLVCAPGVYWDQQVVPLAAVSSVARPLTVIGDWRNSYGFKTSGGILLPPGLVRWANRLSSEVDENPASTAAVLDLNANKPNAIVFRDIEFSAGGLVVILGLPGPTDIDFVDCGFLGGGGASSIVVQYQSGAAIALHHTYTRCYWQGSGHGLGFNLSVAAASADVDLDIVVEDPIAFLCAAGSSTIANLIHTFNTQGGNKPGGVVVRGAEAFAGRLLNIGAGHSTVTPSRMADCLLVGGFQIANANSGTQIVDDGYCRTVHDLAAPTNVTLAGTSKRNVMANILTPFHYKHGYPPRRSVFGWLPEAVAAQRFSGSSSTRPDYYGGHPRPWGAGPSIGAIESPDISLDTGARFATGGDNSLKMIGAGDFVRDVPVSAVSTTITVLTVSPTYGGANKPQLIVEANPSLGIANDLVDTADDDSEQTLSLTFAPTAAGVVRVILRSRSNSGSTETYWDEITRIP